MKDGRGGKGGDPLGCSYPLKTIVEIWVLNILHRLVWVRRLWKLWDTGPGWWIQVLEVDLWGLWSSLFFFFSGPCFYFLTCSAEANHRASLLPQVGSFHSHRPMSSLVMDWCPLNPESEVNPAPLSGFCQPLCHSDKDPKAARVLFWHDLQGVSRAFQTESEALCMISTHPPLPPVLSHWVPQTWLLCLDFQVTPHQGNHLFIKVGRTTCEESVKIPANLPMGCLWSWPPHGALGS